MGLFGLGKKDKDVVDLTERYKKQKEKEKKELEKKEKSSSVPGIFSFFDTPSETSSKSDSSEEILDLSNNSERGFQEKRRRLAKRLTDMTEKLEDLSNKIYHLEQRLEVVEKRTNVRDFD